MSELGKILNGIFLNRKDAISETGSYQATARGVVFVKNVEILTEGDGDGKEPE